MLGERIEVHRRARVVRQLYFCHKGAAGLLAARWTFSNEARRSVASGRVEGLTGRTLQLKVDTLMEQDLQCCAYCTPLLFCTRSTAERRFWEAVRVVDRGGYGDRTIAAGIHS